MTRGRPGIRARQGQRSRSRASLSLTARPGIGRTLALVAVLGLAVSGCASVPAPTPTVGPTASVTAPATPTPAPTPRGSVPPVVLDPALLAILPAKVGGVSVESEPDAFTDALDDPAFVDNVQAAVFATVVSGSDLASGVVARLRPGVFSDAFFRDWRDTYDAGACEPAGGVTGNAEAQLGGRTVYLATCSGGLNVYHAYLPQRGVLVSLFSLGDQRFGEQLMTGLRP